MVQLIGCRYLKNFGLFRMNTVSRLQNLYVALIEIILKNY